MLSVFRLVLQFVMPETVVISIMVDTIIFGFLFVLALGMCAYMNVLIEMIRTSDDLAGGVGAVSSNAGFYRRWDIG